jgi:hypothetical protein
VTRAKDDSGIAESRVDEFVSSNFMQNDNLVNMNQHRTNPQGARAAKIKPDQRDSQ